MFESNGLTKTRDFVKHIELLGQVASDRQVVGFQKTERELVQEFIADTKELIEYNEWGIGLENLMTSLYEIDFKVDSKAIDLAKDAIQGCEMNYERWKFIEELHK
jgi:hypothetical protein